jgi:hypothetical protein
MHSDGVMVGSHSWIVPLWPPAWQKSSAGYGATHFAVQPNRYEVERAQQTCPAGQSDLLRHGTSMYWPDWAVVCAQVVPPGEMQA